MIFFKAKLYTPDNNSTMNSSIKVNLNDIEVKPVYGDICCNELPDNLWVSIGKHRFKVEKAENFEPLYKSSVYDEAKFRYRLESRDSKYTPIIIVEFNGSFIPKTFLTDHGNDWLDVFKVLVLVKPDKKIYQYSICE